MVERRATAPFNVRATDDALGSFSGIASRFEVVDAYRTMMGRGCFDRTLSERGSKRPLCWQHDSNEPIGSFNARATDEGLAVDGQFNLDVERGRNAYALIKKGDISGLSIGFNVRQSEPLTIDGEIVERFTDVDLWEASVVTFPACPGAEVTDVRSMERMTRGLDDLDDDAKKAVAEIFESTAKSIRDTIGKATEKAQEDAEEEKPSEDTTEEPKPADEPEKDAEKDDKDDTEERAIAILRECRSILARGH